MDVIVANLDRPKENTDFLTLFAEYTHGMLTPEYGGDGKLPQELAVEIKKRPNIIVFLAYQEGKPAGFAVTIEAFSTFRAMPLLNIHDIGVAGAFRKQGVGKALMKSIQEEAIRRNCCKLSLEVHEHNTSAFNLYQAMGYSSLTGEGTSERTLFMVKHL